MRDHGDGEDGRGGARQGAGAGDVADVAGQDAAEDAADVEQRRQVGAGFVAQVQARLFDVARQPVQERVVDQLREEQAQRELDDALPHRKSNIPCNRFEINLETEDNIRRFQAKVVNTRWPGTFGGNRSPESSEP